MASAAGRTTRRFRKMAANLRAQRRPCCYCGQSIDYTLPAGDAASFTVEHIKPLSTHPNLAEDPGNLDAMHLACNASKGNRETKPGIGVTSENW